MKVLMTGSNGFIGSRLKAALLAAKHQVMALSHDELYFMDVVREDLEDFVPDYIFHLAAYGNINGQDQERAMVRANLSNVFELLEASSTVKYSAFINVGSSSEYGTKSKAMKETDSLDTDTFYGATKAAGTLIARAFAKKYDKPVVTVRPFSVYGAGDNPAHFIPTAIEAFKHNKPLNLAPGVHDWIHVDDFISGMLLVAEHAKELQGQAVNIGTGQQTSNREIISMLRTITGKPGNIITADKMRDYDTTTSWVADNSLLKSLGWEQKHSLEDDLADLII